MNTHLTAALALLVAANAACVHSTHNPGVNKDRNLITSEELARSHFISAYEAVEALHYNWLLTHGNDSFRSPTKVWVYFETIRLGGVETLHDVSARSISYIRRYDGLEATARFGLGHGAGVIQLLAHADDGTSSQRP